MSFLTINRLSKAYPGVQALKEVSFTVEAGQVHALVGENGAGKSTLIKILAGAVRADAGTMTLGGQPYNPHTPREALAAGVSTIYQIFNLLPDRSIAHNVLLGRESHGRFGLLDQDAMRVQTARILKRLYAEHLSPAQTVDTLKVGEKQIVEIAKSLVNESRLLIMDEPTSALNQVEATALFDVIRSLRDAGVTIFYVSHRLDEIFELADTVTVMRDGTHISTQPIAGLTRDLLVEQMIGRRLEAVFPPRQPRMGREPLLTVEGLRAGNRLADVSFTLYRGEVLAVAGLSGSGKTELGQALYGDLRLDSGRMTLRGQPYRPAPWTAIRSRLVYLPEDRKAEGVFQEMSVRRNISISVLDRFAVFPGLLNLKRERDIAAQQIRRLDIKTPHMDQDVLNLSGGNQQKVALAKCLSIDPEILVLVEPTQGIDVGVKFEIYQFIVDQVAAGCAVLLISSEIPEILGLSHRVLVMQEGRIAAELETAATTQAEILRCALGEVQPAPV
jgi:ABC-type sugar transport system ATPase subunit